MSNLFKRVIAPAAMLAASSLGFAACGGSSNEVAECPKNFAVTSVKVKGAAPVIRAFGSLANQSVNVGDGDNQDPYDMNSPSWNGYNHPGSMSKVNNPSEVVCVVGKEGVYLSPKSLEVVGRAESDGYKFDFEEGTATKAE